jgi:hypothetical protein
MQHVAFLQCADGFQQRRTLFESGRTRDAFIPIDASQDASGLGAGVELRIKTGAAIGLLVGAETLR